MKFTNGEFTEFKHSTFKISEGHHNLATFAYFSPGCQILFTWDILFSLSVFMYRRVKIPVMVSPIDRSTTSTMLSRDPTKSSSWVWGKDMACLYFFVSQLPLC